MNFLQDPISAALKRTLRDVSKIPYGVDFLDDALLGIFPTDLLLIGAGTGVGKTQMGKHIAYNALKLSKNVDYFALESEQGEIEERIMWEEISREWWRRNPMGKQGVHLRYMNWRSGLLEDELFEIEKSVHPLVSVTLSTLKTIYSKEMNPKQFVEILKARQYETDLIVLDHLHYFDFGDDENRALKEAVKLIRETALEIEKPVIVIAHLRKGFGKSDSPLPDIDDFFGSSDLVKIGVNVVMLARAENETLSSGQRATWVYIPKSRHAGDAQGYAAIQAYDPAKGSYSSGYYLHRAKRWKEPELLIGSQIPRWAKRAKVDDRDGRVF